MMRTVMAAVFALFLTGCWGSEENLFGPSDLAEVEIAGEYRFTVPGSEEIQRVMTAVPQPDRTIELSGTDPETGAEERMRLGLVAIDGGSGEYFLAFDMTRGSQGQLYLLVHLDERGVISFYMPECAGTPDLPGMEREDVFGSSACKFTSKAAILTAAREAEAFLSRPHIVDVQPFRQMEPWSEAAEAAERDTMRAMEEFEAEAN